MVDCEQSGTTISHSALYRGRVLKLIAEIKQKQIQNIIYNIEIRRAKTFFQQIY